MAKIVLQRRCPGSYAVKGHPGYFVEQVDEMMGPGDPWFVFHESNPGAWLFKADKRRDAAAWLSDHLETQAGGKD